MQNEESGTLAHPGLSGWLRLCTSDTNSTRDVRKMVEILKQTRQVCAHLLRLAVLNHLQTHC